MLLQSSDENTDPAVFMHNEEFEHLCLSFCSLVCIIKNKKLNLAKIFLLILNDEDIKELYLSMIEIDDVREAIRLFLDYNPSLYKSKYIKRHIDPND